MFGAHILGCNVVGCWNGNDLSGPHSVVCVSKC